MADLFGAAPRAAGGGVFGLVGTSLGRLAGSFRETPKGRARRTTIAV